MNPSPGPSRGFEAHAARIPMEIAPAQAQKFIVNRLTGQKVSFGNLLRTHPTTEARVARLRGTTGRARLP